MNRRGKPGRQLAPLKEKTVHAHLTKQRIHAIVGQVLDELENRRANGKADYVTALADEVEKGGIAAWKSLRDLLPRDEAETPSGGVGAAATAAFAGIFAGAAAQAAAQRRAVSDNTTLPIIDVQAQPVPASDEQQHTPGEETDHVEW